jgi:hypothetical protein
MIDLVANIFASIYYFTCHYIGIFVDIETLKSIQSVRKIEPCGHKSNPQNRKQVGCSEYALEWNNRHNGLTVGIQLGLDNPPAGQSIRLVSNNVKSVYKCTRIKYTSMREGKQQS